MGIEVLVRTRHVVDAALATVAACACLKLLYEVRKKIAILGKFAVQILFSQITLITQKILQSC